MYVVASQHDDFSDMFACAGLDWQKEPKLAVVAIGPEDREGATAEIHPRLPLQTHLL